MWKYRIKKLCDNPFVVFSYIRNRLVYYFLADKISAQYNSEVIFLSGTDTISAITKSDTSLIRVGDGTFGYLTGSSIYFQNWIFRFDKKFARELERVLKDGQNENILFCFPHTLITKSKEQYKAEGIKNEWFIWTNAKVLVQKYLRAGKIYGDSTCFHPKYNQSIDFAALQRYFSGKHIFIITSNSERFHNIEIGKSVTFINAPSSDAWRQYPELETETLAKIKDSGYLPHEVLIMVSAAEAAKVMIYNFTRQGYTAWDTGQFFELAAKELTSLRNERS